MGTDTCQVGLAAHFYVFFASRDGPDARQVDEDDKNRCISFI